VQAFDVMRFANRVPLLYQQGICAITKAVEETEWRRYNVQMNREVEDPLVIFAHLCSVWVPFTSESKEAIANYDIIVKEIKLALQECARKLSLWLSGKRKSAMLSRKKSLFERYAAETAGALAVITGASKKDIISDITNLITNKWGQTDDGTEIEEKEVADGEQDEGEDSESGKGSD